MENRGKKVFASPEIVVLALAGLLVLVYFIFRQAIQRDPLYRLALAAAAVLTAAGYWFWHNYKVVKAEPEQPSRIWEKMEGILHTLFLPRGYDIISLPSVDDRQTGWAVLRDVHGIGVVIQYIEWSLEKTVRTEELMLLDERMSAEGTPKGICLTTSLFDQEALQYARSRNILTKDSDQLMEMLKRVEEQTRPPQEYRCRHCGSRLEENPEIKDLMVCVNPDCGKTFSVEELDEERREHSGVVKSLRINCYGCGRPVELDTGMRGLMECPYDDCSWIINVDNELLALRGGLDKRVSERLAEIRCPKCAKMIKVPADAEGLMECPCPEKWVIDVGAALAERAEVQVAQKIAGGQAAESAAGTGGTGDTVAGEKLLDCPGCGAGVPVNLSICPVCGTPIQARERAAAEAVSVGRAQEVQLVATALPPRQIKHRHAFMALSTNGLLFFFIISVSAFLLFVYFITR